MGLKGFCSRMPLRALWILYIVHQVNARCGSLCQCNGREAVCGGINSLTDLKLSDSVVEVHIKGGAFPVVGPNSFGDQVEIIKFIGCKIGEIQSEAFSNLHNLQKLLFKASVISRIMPCGFSSLDNVLDIAFSTVSINDVKKGAFNNITGLESLNISQSEIINLQSLAFHNIEAKSISFSDTSLENIETAAFSKLYNVESFALHYVDVQSMASGAFHNISNFTKVQIKMSGFQKLHHKTLMELREATPRNHEGFHFEDSIIACECSSAPLLEYIQRNPTSVSESVKCSLPSKSIAEVTPENVCRGYQRQKYCHKINLSPPTCLTAVISSQILQVETICPTRLQADRSDKPHASKISSEKNGWVITRATGQSNASTKTRRCVFGFMEVLFASYFLRATLLRFT
ncbi:leucine-rich repeat and immunoglobulin domain-containing nogo receptor-interacting protein [Plakobranchus ocellatus]|uniref:Leucine-rich repeat and immunoglobulin domain-containing nogo receptor-interacting protein n=1 Tax=Plakobranchus ocellatus TaxID=259542 RepID=A0AAV4B5U0_9GAST|nr:leucine-rich repeat and immunoglobulin domain-containing nogo receptor-interacting protein [Plakobranchus ocellatus]